MKFFKIISFWPFLTQIGHKFGPIWSFNLCVAFVAIFALNFHSGVCTTTTFSFNRYSPCKIWKKLIDNACFLTFHNIGPNLAQILPTQLLWLEMTLFGKKTWRKIFVWSQVMPNSSDQNGKAGFTKSKRHLQFISINFMK